MMKMILLLGLVSQLAFAQNQVSPGFDGTLPDGADLLAPNPVQQETEPTSYEVMSVILKDARFAKLAAVTADQRVADVSIGAPRKSKFEESFYYPLTLTVVTADKMASFRWLCANVELRNGPGPNQDMTESVRFNRKWWVSVVYSNKSCPH